MADLFRQSIGMKNLKYTKYSCVFHTSTCQKISRRPLLLIESELPDTLLFRGAAWDKCKMESGKFPAARCRGGDSRARRCTCARNRLSIKWQTPPNCHSEERSDVGISQYPFGSQGNLRRKRNCLHEIATAPVGPRNDKPLAFTVLSAACTGRQYRAGSGMPLPYNGRCMHRGRPKFAGCTRCVGDAAPYNTPSILQQYPPQKMQSLFSETAFFYRPNRRKCALSARFFCSGGGGGAGRKAQTPPSGVGMMSYCQTINGRSAQNLAEFLEQFYEIDFVVIQSVDIPVSSGV